MNAHNMCDANQEQLNFCNSSASPGASSIIGSTFDAANHNLQLHNHFHQADNKSTIGAIARANYRGRLYNNTQHNGTNSHSNSNSDDIEKDSISNSDTTRDLNIASRSKKLSWHHEDFQVGQACMTFTFQMND
jgi:hypothetical protein